MHERVRAGLWAGFLDTQRHLDQCLGAFTRSCSAVPWPNMPANVSRQMCRNGRLAALVNHVVGAGGDGDTYHPRAPYAV